VIVMQINMSGEAKESFLAEDIAKEEGISIEKQQELLLMNKLAASGKLPPKSAGSFLQKKLQQRKFFDSGDYAMNQQNKDRKPPPMSVPNQPDSIPAKVTSPIEKLPDNPQEELVISVQPITASPIVEAHEESDEESHLQIPRPDTVPQRKSSILHPSVHSKLSPTPLIHRDEHESVTCHHTFPQ